MANSGSAMARRALDRRIKDLIAGDVNLTRPAGGWIRAVREAIGMSAEQFGQRLGTTRQAVHQLERSEVDDGIRLDSLRRAAEALNCRFVYAFVPTASLEDSVWRRAVAIASRELSPIDQTMLLENQELVFAERSAQVQERARELVASRQLWERSALDAPEARGG
jgi:predicted DNA-binding mobile mystery protein A